MLGTGDLSELALGWATYGVGDQMSHYNVNGGVPKTFIQHLIRWVIEHASSSTTRCRQTLDAILDTEISPELVPGEELQSTESQIGPYALQDFYALLRRCATASGRRRSPSWRGTPGATRRAATGRRTSRTTKRVAYDLPEIRRWLELFCRRFFAFAQFKRSALPNGPKVSAGGSLSPRGDWRAPSDGSAGAWLRDHVVAPALRQLRLHDARDPRSMRSSA